MATARGPRGGELRVHIRTIAAPVDDAIPIVDTSKLRHHARQVIRVPCIERQVISIGLGKRLPVGVGEHGDRVFAEQAQPMSKHMGQGSLARAPLLPMMQMIWAIAVR